MTGIAALVVVAAASAVYTGEQSRKSASKSLKQQKAAQRQSLLSTVNAEAAAARADRKANRKKPDIDSLLFAERAKANTGVGSTILAGKGGGGTSLLGTKSSLIGG